MSFGYATAEFEVTSERLGVYRPEEHIDNPKGYAEGEDARKYDQRLRGPVRPVELEIDPNTGMKNYIANEHGDWATSVGFIKYSFEKSIHHGRLYTNGHGFFKGKDEDLAEALRCLGQGLHTLEDFGAHTNYTELALREMGFHDVFPHTGTATMMNVQGHHVFPLVTGTFGTVDFLHSVLGEATDHFTQSEVNEVDNALGTAQKESSSSNPCGKLVGLLSKVPGCGDLCTEAERLQQTSQAQARANETGGNQPTGWGSSRGMNEPSAPGYDNYSSSRAGPGDWNQGGNFQHQDWQQQSQFNQGWDQSQHGWQQPQQQWNQPPQQWDQHQPPQYWDPQQAPQQWAQQPPPQHWDQSQQPSWQQPQQPPHDFSQPQGQISQMPASSTGPEKVKPPSTTNFDPQKTISQIYPILVFRDKVVRTISSIIEKIPGLEALVDKITETLTLFIFSLLAPFVRPLISLASKSLQTGSSGVVDASGKHQYEPWTDPHCTDPTHSLLSKDHFSNILNPPAGAVATEILKYAASRVLYAWQHPNVPVDHVLGDVMRVFHHPALRDTHNVEVHRNMFEAVQRWVNARPDRGANLGAQLGAEAVRQGKNHAVDPAVAAQEHNHLPGAQMAGHYQQTQHGTQQAHGAQQGHGGGGGGWQSQLGQFAAPFTGGGGSSQHGQHGQHGGQGPLGQLGQLPIPGLSDLNKKINKFSHFVPGGLGGGGHRGLDEGAGSSRGLDAGPEEEKGEGMYMPSGYEQYGPPPGVGEGNYYQGEGGGGGGYQGYQQQGGGGAAGDYYRA
ncbi:MAG: hypothetical protein Q9227_006772 [Pyrenula ochraceoflavens]